MGYLLARLPPPCSPSVGAARVRQSLGEEICAQGQGVVVSKLCLSEGGRPQGRTGNSAPALWCRKVREYVASWPGASDTVTWITVIPLSVSRLVVYRSMILLPANAAAADQGSAQCMPACGLGGVQT